MATLLQRATACSSPALRQCSKRGVVRTSGRRLSVGVRAVLPGSEQITNLATQVVSAHDGLVQVVQNLYQLADDSATAAATSTSSQSGGAFGWVADGFEAFLKVLESGLNKAGVPYSYGFAIILLTVLVKVATYPLSKKSMESTMAMQAVAPRVKELQAKYANDPENLQLETARLYKSAGINPLAGCLPTLATIPVFIGLYRALTKAADEGLLTSGFFWIPSLGGPTSMAMRQAGSGLSWLFPFKDGQPPIGWHDAIAYLILPALLVVSQFASQKIVSPKTDDPQQKQTQAILGFIPFMIGWFSLNVPSGLTLYWFVNNIISTALQLYMKQTIKMDLSPAAAAGDASGIIDVTGTVIKPKEDRVKQVSGKELGARKKRREDEEVSPSSTAADSSSSSAAPRSNRGQKFRARKSREAAAKAASVAQANGSAEQGAKATATSELDLVKVPDAAPSKE